jgi:hypothetical protein
LLGAEALPSASADSGPRTLMPSAPPTSQCASTNSFAWEASTTKARPRLALNSNPLGVGAMLLTPAEETPARVVAAVAPVEATGQPSTPLSVALSR